MITTPNPHADRMSIVNKHLAAYEAEGAALRSEMNEIEAYQTKITDNPSVRLIFGNSQDNAVFSPNYYDRSESVVRPIVLTMPGVSAPRYIWSGRVNVDLHKRMDRASEIALPGLRACLLMWLNEWRVRVERDLAAWAARDPIAEAVDLAAKEPA